MAKMDNKTCIRLEVDEGAGVYGKKVIFVKSIWDSGKFTLAVSDGLRAWTFDGSEEFVKERARTWDKPVPWVMEKLQLYLSVRQPDTKYSFISVAADERKLKFPIQTEDDTVQLIANLQMKCASDPENVTLELLGFLLDGNCRLSVDYVKKCRSFDSMKLEAEAYQEQNKRFMNEKVQFEQDIYKKFVAVLNAKKMKLKELRGQLAKWTAETKLKEEDESEDATSGSDSDEDESDHEADGTSLVASRQNPVSTSGLKSLTRKRKEECGGSHVDQRGGSDKILDDLGPHKPGLDATSAGNILEVGSSIPETGAKKDIDATQPFEDLEMVSEGNIAPVAEALMDAGPSNAAAAALLGGSSYAPAPRKRRRM